MQSAESGSPISEVGQSEAPTEYDPRSMNANDLHFRSPIQNLRSVVVGGLEWRVGMGFPVHQRAQACQTAIPTAGDPIVSTGLAGSDFEWAPSPGRRRLRSGDFTGTPGNSWSS